jgi:putative DNA primase/helicase
MNPAAKTSPVLFTIPPVVPTLIPVAELPELVVDETNLPETANTLSNYLASSPVLFERGTDIIKVIRSEQGISTVPLNAHSIVNEAHALCRPILYEVHGGDLVKMPVTLPHRVANLLLNQAGQRQLRVLRGISLAPLLAEDGSIRCAPGYDKETGYWCECGQLPAIPERPTREQAFTALSLIRAAFSTFPFADAAISAPNENAVVDLSVPPAQDESTFLTALMTAACQPSLPLAPALLIRAPQFSGAGTGKGHLVRAIAQIAYGIQPKAFTSSSDKRELSKRIESALVESAAMVFLDNCNSEQLSSNVLAQVITESSVVTRLLGQTKMVPLTANAFIAVTGNAVQVSEDLARRFLVVELDAKQEHPEQRFFSDDFERNVRSRRAELLAAVLTIWRWGRQNYLARGAPLGSFEQWALWCRDPLLALGCMDPVLRVAELKARDPQRQRAAGILEAWFACHGSKPVRFRDLDPRVSSLLEGNPQTRVTRLQQLENVRVGGFVLESIKPEGKWSPKKYMVHRKDT